MKLVDHVEGYRSQRAGWPSEGRHILAAYDDERIVVYQAYRPEIADAAVRAQAFVSPWRKDRMTWIKPGFLWMMYRSSWATALDQERILAVHVKRAAFDRYLATAVHSSYQPEIYESSDAWKRAVRGSNVRLQWDPDHGPGGDKRTRRAIQLGLRGETVRGYACADLLGIEDITDFVRA